MSEPGARAAKRAGLRYVSDGNVPGITRHGKPGHFRYRGPGGKPVADKATLQRIRSLVLPPAWHDVWISPHANAHLAATGRDDRGRKQYRYHPKFAAIRDADKYAHLADFAAALPKLRRRLRRDLRRSGLVREKILAAVVTLLEETLIRVGNEDYARTNHSFGLTTLHNNHVRARGAALRFHFKGKSGKFWDLEVRDPKVARIVRSCQELPGQHLFEYRDGAGDIHAISSTDVNRYLQEIAGRDITAKDFRTWAGTVAAAEAFMATAEPPGKRTTRNVVADVARKLGNTVAVCRKCYIHPDVINAFEAGSLKLSPRARGGLTGMEGAVAAFLARRRRRAKRV
jgi:DNA topoisomerase-1